MIVSGTELLTHWNTLSDLSLQGRSTIKLGNIFKKNVEHNVGIDQCTETLPDTSSDSGIRLRDSVTNMEVPKGPGKEGDGKMDFESGIDLWIIDKDETLEKGLGGSPNIVSSTTKTMNKENIKTPKSSASKQSLRCFRIRKSVNYQELSSDSESDTNNKKLSDSFDPKNFKKLDSLNATSKLCHKITSISDKEKKRIVGSLSSEEISVLTEGDSSYDEVHEKNRETLLSIENVSNPDKNRDIFVSSVSSFICPTCLCECNSLEDLRSHERIHLRDIATSCTHNPINHQHSKSFNDNKSLWNNDFLGSFKNHLISEGEPHLNKICKKSKNKRSKLRHASDSDTDEKFSKKTYFCHVCSYSCQEQLILKTHQILFHSEMKVLKCEYCDYKTSQCANLATHIRMHFLLNCPSCDFHSSFKTSFKNHLLTHHNNKAVYKCKKCPYENRSKFFYKKHIELHKLALKYKCDTCNVFLPSKKILQLHQRKHKPTERMFKCSHCSVPFSDKQLLNIHERSHKPMRVCSICNLSFANKNLLKCHMKVHSTETFTCNKCSSVFQRKYHLIRHMHVHEPEMTKCQHCSFECFSVNDLSKHNCIDKLYNVQKRPLNFKNVVSKIGAKKHQIVKIKKEAPKKFTDVKKKKQNPKLETTSISVKTKKVESKVKVLSRCKNLPSCKSQKIAECGPNIAKYTKRFKQDHIVKEEKKQNSFKSLVKEDLNRESRGRKRDCSNKQAIVPPAKKIRRGKFCKSLDVATILFGKKPTPSVEISLCSQESFVQCSNNNHTPESHLMAPLNQNQLRSCGNCLYKTNNKKLLEAHSKKVHSWSPKVISTLFR